MSVKGALADNDNSPSPVISLPSFRDVQNIGNTFVIKTVEYPKISNFLKTISSLINKAGFIFFLKSLQAW